MKWGGTAGHVGEGVTPSACGAQPPQGGVHEPEDLLAEGLLLLRADAGRGEAILLHGLLDPDAQVAETVLVQGKEDFCEVIHEAAGSLATDTLPRSTDPAEPLESPSPSLGSASALQQCCLGTKPKAAPLAHLQHRLQQHFAVLMHDLSHRGDLSAARQQLRLQHSAWPAQCRSRLHTIGPVPSPSPAPALPAPSGLHNATILTKKPQDALTVGASGNLSERTPVGRHRSGQQPGTLHAIPNPPCGSAGGAGCLLCRATWSACPCRGTHHTQTLL